MDLTQLPELAGAPAVAFDLDEVVLGLRTAMGVGMPVAAADRATFVFPGTATTPAPADEDGVPFDPSARLATTPPRQVQVPCAVEYRPAVAVVEDFASITRSRIEITLLGPDYEQVKGFAFVLLGGERFVYRYTAAPAALLTLAVWTVVCEADDDA